MKKTLVVMVAVCAVLAFVGGAYAQEATYIGNKQCKICHSKAEEGEQWTKWKASPHAKALEALATPEAKALADKAKLDKPAAEAPQCLKCHVTAFDEKTGAPTAPLLKEDGVQCEMCHGPASLHVADGKKFKSGDKTVNMAAHIKPTPDEAVCKGCHNEQSATWKADRYTLEGGGKAGFDFKQAAAKLAHPNPTKKK